MNREENRTVEMDNIAGEIMRIAHDGILVHMRFLDVALSKLVTECREKTGAHLFDGARLIYDPLKLLHQYKEQPCYAARLYLHTLLHCVFLHGLKTEQLCKEYWNLATDIAVENTILELELSITALPTDELLRQRCRALRKQAGGLTAEKIYRCFKLDGISQRGKEEWNRLTHYDEHIYWNRKEVTELPAAEWRKLAERIKVDLKSFSRDKNNVFSVEDNLKEATKEKHDYRSFLQKFMVMHEDVYANDDEFDYIYYTYGLKHYGNMPLVEPLEYKEVNKLKDFVIVIDTSASCRGEIVARFLSKTYAIMKNTENFFTQINVHILLCDNEVRQDIRITDQGEFDDFIKNGKLTGFGATDFRPAFDYVEELKKKGEFENLRGLLYFTDGYGVFPEYMPSFETAFVFLQDDENAPKCPPWSIKVILDENDFDNNELIEE